jgi:hypothetical protein
MRRNDIGSFLRMSKDADFIERPEPLASLPGLLGRFEKPQDCP